MGCSTCGSNKNGSTCSTTHSTGGCSGGCKTGGCNKLNVFNWLSDMEPTLENSFDTVEVRFKNGRKEFFKNKHLYNISTGEAVIVEVNVTNAYHIGYVSLTGELVRLQMQKKKIPNDEKILHIIRTATQEELETYSILQEKEISFLQRAREIVIEKQIAMKITYAEYQADGKRITFYYSAEQKVDFRELVKIFGTEFKTKIGMWQITSRQEAARIGGIGSCGRELCCSTWLTDLKNVYPSAARYQNISVNTSKIIGQCGKLKCCLNYELDTYVEAMKNIPDVKIIETNNGTAYIQKIDIFRKIMWFTLDGKTNWQAVDVERVKEIIELKKNNIKPDTLFINKIENQENKEINSDLVLLEKGFKKKKNKK
ncbi:MAG: regulatory iron-sulfur-containing complex subunit RicT [Chitinophagaceae bacterium]|nr:regulatory iron-sulfur-containing complex subunit RicT [Chitinophagaceae bacterium]